MSSKSIYHWSDTASSFYVTIISTIGIFLNIIVTHIIKHNTPCSVKKYSVVIRIAVVFNLLFSIASFMSTCRMFVTEKLTIWIFRGFCTMIYEITDYRFLSTRFCSIIYIFELNFFLYSQYILIYSYFYRYMAITRPFTDFNKFSIHVAVFVFATAFTVFFHFKHFLTADSQKEIDSIVRVVKPKLLYSKRVYNAGIHADNVPYILFFYLFFFTIAIVIIVARFCNFKISRSLQKLNLSRHARMMHRSFLNVLRAQTITSVVGILSALLYMVYFKTPSLRTPLVGNIIFMPMITTCIITPMSILMFIIPYRNAFCRLISQHYKPSSVIVSLTR